MFYFMLMFKKNYFTSIYIYLVMILFGISGCDSDEEKKQCMAGIKI